MLQVKIRTKIPKPDIIRHSKIAVLNTSCELHYLWFEMNLYEIPKLKVDLGLSIASMHIYHLYVRTQIDLRSLKQIVLLKGTSFSRSHSTLSLHDAFLFILDSAT